MSEPSGLLIAGIVLLTISMLFRRVFLTAARIEPDQKSEPVEVTEPSDSSGR
jgi:hypothetical protein